jgi:superfamily II DNA or RNA helicase
MTPYDAMIASKRRAHGPVGFDAGPLNASLFPHQAAIVTWACRMGRCAIFADTGLGKSLMQLEWARLVAKQTSGRVLILAPLAVRDQTIAEAIRFGIDAGLPGTASAVHVTNYHKLHQIDPTEYAGVVLDESSILKACDGKTRTQIIRSFAAAQYRLACTATPAPNDFTELGNHAEFLGVCSYQEMLSEFFVHDGGSTQDWRLKGHSIASFWQWVASWAVLVRRPSDLGIEDDRYDLPPLNVRESVVSLGAEFAARQGSLFVTDALGLTEQRGAKRESVGQRCEVVAAEVAATPGQWLVWCELNDESSCLAAAIPDAVEVTGSDDPDDKADRMLAFARGEIRVLVTKPKIAGFGMNWQICNQMAFVGITHSYEQWYQSVRRCWRFGQTRAVDVLMVRTDAEGSVWASLKAKADAADAMALAMIEHVRDTQLESVMGRRPGRVDKTTQPARIPSWL